MSVLELTLSYRKIVTYGDLDAPVLTYRQKRTVTLLGFSLFIVIMIGYLYTMGSVIAKNYERNSLSSQLQQSLSRAQETEQQALGINSIYTSEYFIEHGYMKPKTLGIIKRARDVAESQISYFY